MKNRVIIVDDEADARNLLKAFLTDFPDFICVAEATNGLEAVQAINTHRPDLVFLDINMPGLNGFEVLSHLKEIPQIIFSTAYDSYAIKAFEVHALDYLLKPYGRKRFSAAMSRIEQQLHKLQTLAETVLQEQDPFPAKIIVQKAKRLILIETKDIFRLEAFGDYTKVFTQDEQYLSNSGISVLEKRLPAQYFKRVHRSAMVNFDHVQELSKKGRVHNLILTNGDQVRVSEGYLSQVKALML